jgi:hypothetical protein
LYRLQRFVDDRKGEAKVRQDAMGEMWPAIDARLNDANSRSDLVFDNHGRRAGSTGCIQGGGNAGHITATTFGTIGDS